MRVRLDRADDRDVASLGLREKRLDRERGVDDDRDARFLVADQIGRTAEVVVQELVEDHACDRSTRSRYLS